MTVLEFENFLRKGIGRCALALNDKDSLLRYKETVLECCLKSVSRYTDVEKSRGAFLYMLVKKFGEDDFFLNPAIEAYKEVEAGEGLSDGSLLQITDFLWCFSKENNNNAYDALKEKLLTYKEKLCNPQPDESTVSAFKMICFSFIEHDGFGGYIRAIQSIDDICIKNADFSHKDFENILRAKCDTYQHRRILKEVSLNASRKMHMYFYRLFRLRVDCEIKPQQKPSAKLFPNLDEVRLSVTQIIQQERQSEEKLVLDVCEKIIALHEIKCEKHVPKDFLLFVYENSPCAYLRARAVHFMGKKKMITPELAEECLYDCDDYIRSYIKQYQRHRLS